jgi:hypothetical protein
MLELNPRPAPRVEHGRQTARADAGVTAERGLPRHRDAVHRVGFDDIVGHAAV